MRRVLVTGAAGFIGSHCLQPLRARGFEVHAVSRRPPAAGGDVIWHQADLLDTAAHERLFAESAPTDLLHAAWDTNPGAHLDDRVANDWLRASVALFGRAMESGVTRIVGLGTCWEYDARWGWCREVATPLQPLLPYGRAKAILGRRLLAMEQPGLTTAWGRVFFGFGPGDRSRRLIPSAIQTLLAGRPFECSQGTQIRDFVFAEDLGGAIAALLASPVVGAVNLASGTPRTVRSIVAMIARALDRTDLVRFGAVTPEGFEAEPVLIADTRRLATEVAWHPAVSCGEGIQRTIKWWREQAAGDAAQSATVSGSLARHIPPC
jgi:nucleoside-diphosphate-sugar epimerase